MIKKVLLADDEEPIRSLVAATLGHDERYRLLLAEDGEEALTLARRESPDLVILDVVMPNLDGIEVCRCRWSTIRSRLTGQAKCPHGRHYLDPEGAGEIQTSGHEGWLI